MTIVQFQYWYSFPGYAPLTPLADEFLIGDGATGPRLQARPVNDDHSKPYFALSGGNNGQAHSAGDGRLHPGHGPGRSQGDKCRLYLKYAAVNVVGA